MLCGVSREDKTDYRRDIRVNGIRLRIYIYTLDVFRRIAKGHLSITVIVTREGMLICGDLYLTI